MKTLDHYLGLNYPITIDKFFDDDKKEKFVAEITDLPGCSAHAESLEDAITKLEEAKKAWIEVSIERGLEIPEPVSEDDFSGKFLLRIPAKLHKQLVLRANRDGFSLNHYVRKVLESNIDQDVTASEVEHLLEKYKKDISIRLDGFEQILKAQNPSYYGSPPQYSWQIVKGCAIAETWSIEKNRRKTDSMYAVIATQ